MDTFGSTVDFPCLFQQSCTVTEPTQFGAEAVLTVESVQALPIDLNFKLPDLKFSLQRSVDYDSNSGMTTDEAHWKLLATLVLDGGTYDLHRDKVGGTYITTERLYVPDVKEALNTIDLQNTHNNVTFKISTSATESTLLDSVLSEFVIVATLPKGEELTTDEGTTDAASNNAALSSTTPRSITLKLDSTDNEIKLDTTLVMDYGSTGGMTITIAGGNIDVWNSGVGHFNLQKKESSEDHPRDALLDCEELSKSGAGSHRVNECLVGNILWDEISMPSGQTGTMKLITKLVSGSTDGKLLGQMSGEMVAGGSVRMECKGTTRTSNVPGRSGEVVSDISIIVLMPRVVTDDSNLTSVVTEILSDGQTTDSVVTNTVQKIQMNGMTTSGTIVDIPCVMGTSASRCENDVLEQQLSLSTTTTLALQHKVGVQKLGKLKM